MGLLRLRNLLVALKARKKISNQVASTAKVKNKGVGYADFSRHLENAILSFSQTIIFTLVIFINLELLIISLWKKSRCFAVYRALVRRDKAYWTGRSLND